jgi:hypothetical protein
MVGQKCLHSEENACIKRRLAAMRNSIFVYQPDYSAKLQEHQQQQKKQVEQERASNKFDHLRKDLDAKHLKVKRSTIEWARSIPSALRPRALVINYPRIANSLAEAWKNPRLFERQLRALMHDDRGGRKGFGFDVVQDLANLSTYFQQLHKPAAQDVWAAGNKTI